MDYNQRRVIKAAIALGIPRTKGTPQELLPQVAAFQRQIMALGKRGDGNTAPASTVYKASDLYALSKQARALLNQVQNLPKDYANTTRQLTSRMSDMTRYVASWIGDLDKLKASNLSRMLTSQGENMQYALTDLKRSTQYNMRRPG